MLYALKAEVDNLKLEPPRARQNLALSLSGPVALSLREVNMEKYYRVTKHNDSFVVRAKGIRKDIVSFPDTLTGYLKASARAYRGNFVLAHAEMAGAR